MAGDALNWTGQILLDGRYEVGRILGEGGMGAVYQATDHRTGALVVIKVPRRSQLDEPETAQRFQREIRALVRFAHPNVVPILDVGEHDGQPFMVMPFMPGGSLRDRHEPGQPASIATLRGWLSGIADALDFIHGRNYLHRDVKPANIFFEADGRAVLGDFGVVKALAGTKAERQTEALTGSGMILGTAEYLAPELIMGRAHDGRADQYALAVSVYEVLAGRLPFEGENAAATMVLHATKAARPLNERRPELPVALSDAVQRAMAKEPANRFPTCAAFAESVLSPRRLPGSGPLPVRETSTNAPPRAMRTGTVALLAPEQLHSAAVDHEQTERIRRKRRPRRRSKRIPSLPLILAVGLSLLAAALVLGFLAFEISKRSADVVSRGEPPVTGSATPPAPPEAPVVVVPPMPNPDKPPEGPPNKPDVSEPPKPNVPENEIALSLGGEQKLELVLIKAGKFRMGSPATDSDAQDNERPQHDVTMSRPYYLGKTAVTKRQFRSFIDANPIFKTSAERSSNKKTWSKNDYTPDDDCPVVFVSWDDAQAFCKWLSEKTGKVVRLPTEAEREYACRAEATTRYFFGNDAKLLGDFAWYTGNAGGKAHPVGKEKTANKWGLYDIHGNVDEWCQDGEREYPNEPQTDPRGTILGNRHITRGGGFLADASVCRDARRNALSASASSSDLGFRVVCELPASENARNTPSPPCSSRSFGTGLNVEFFDGIDANVPRPEMTSSFANVDFDTTRNLPKGLDKTNISMKWEGYLLPREPGDHQLIVNFDDGFELFLDDQRLMIGRLPRGTLALTLQQVVNLQQGPHRIKILYFNGPGDGRLKLSWKTPRSDREEIVPASAFFRTRDDATRLTKVTDAR